MKAQNMPNFNALGFAQACSALSIAMQKTAMMFQAMRSSMAEMSADIQHFKEHGVPREKTQTYVVHASKNTKVTPDQIKDFISKECVIKSCHLT